MCREWGYHLGYWSAFLLALKLFNTCKILSQFIAVKYPTLAAAVSAVKWYLSLLESHEIIANQNDTNGSEMNVK